MEKIEDNQEKNFKYLLEIIFSIGTKYYNDISSMILFKKIYTYIIGTKYYKDRVQIKFPYPFLCFYLFIYLFFEN